jgi:hypothetical protein
MNPESWNPGYYVVYVVFYILLVGVSVWVVRRARLAGTLKLMFGNVVVFVTLVGALFLVFEGYFLFFYDQTDTFGFIRTSHRWMARHVRRNNLGFRDDAFRPPSDTTVRIGVLGDSFTFGQGVKDPKKRFTDLLEARLNTEKDRRYDVLNVSQLGWDTGDHARLIGKLHTLLRFDTVILAYCMNDIRDLTPAAENIRNIIRSRPAWMDFLASRSLFLDFVLARLTFFRAKDLFRYDWLKEAYDNPALWGMQQARLTRIAAFSKEAKVPLYFVIFPMLAEEWQDYSLTEVHQRLREFLTGQGIPVLDLMEIYRQYPVKELWVSRYDTHPNEMAHRLAAEAIYAKWFNFE